MANQFFNLKGGLDNSVRVEIALGEYLNKYFKNDSFDWIGNKIRKLKGADKDLNRVYYLEFNQAIDYLKIAKHNNKFIDDKGVIRERLLQDVNNFLISKLTKETYIRGLQDDRDFKEIVGLDSWYEVNQACVSELRELKRDTNSNTYVSKDVSYITSKYMIICSYKGTFATIRGRFTQLRNTVKESDLSSDLKELFLDAFFFHKDLNREINNRTDKTASEKLENKIQIYKSDIDKLHKSLSDTIDDYNIKFDDNVVKANVIEKVEITQDGRIKSIKISDNKKMEVITVLSMYIILSSGRRLSEVITVPTNIKERLENYSKNVDGFNEKNINLDIQDVILQDKNNNERVIFLNQKKMRKGDDIKGYYIPILGGYNRLISAIKLLRFLIPATIKRKDDKAISDYLRGYFAKDWSEILLKFDIEKRDNDNKLLGIDRKKMRGIYAVYMRLKYSEYQNSVGLAKLLHGAKDTTVKATAHNYYDNIEIIKTDKPQI